MNLSIRASISLMSVFAFSACCNEVCLSSATIEFDPPVTEAGTYLIEITTDEIHQVCEATLPFPVGANIPYCDGHMPGFGDFVTAKYGESVGFSGFRLGSGPDTIDVRLSRDDVMIGSATLNPAYIDTDNSCGCRNGTTVLPIQ